jgi:lauroyl/myristoyl acyltransferase
MKHGGTVASGVDRPLPQSKYRPEFFGMPTPLPVHYVQLAMKAEVPIRLATAIREKTGRYRIISTPPIEMEQTSNREKSIILNAEKVLSHAEEYIQLAPEQWAVNHPIWPQLLNDVPA